MWVCRRSRGSVSFFRFDNSKVHIKMSLKELFHSINLVPVSFMILNMLVYTRIIRCVIDVR